MSLPIVAKHNNNETSLYLGNLDPQITEVLLYELFVQFAPVKSIKLPKDKLIRKHQGFGFVEFYDIKDAEYIINLLNGLKLYNKPLRVKRIQQQGSDGNTSNGSVDDDFGPIIFIGKLDNLVDEETLTETFSNFGKFSRLPKIIKGDNEIENHAFVYYQDFQSSDTAIQEMRGKMILNKPIKIDYAYKKDSKEKHGDEVERLLYEKARLNNFHVPTEAMMSNSELESQQQPQQHIEKQGINSQRYGDRDSRPKATNDHRPNQETNNRRYGDRNHYSAQQPQNYPAQYQSQSADIRGGRRGGYRGGSRGRGGPVRGNGSRGGYNGGGSSYRQDGNGYNADSHHRYPNQGYGRSQGPY